MTGRLGLACLAAALAASASPAPAHDFWLQPQRWTMAPGRDMRIVLLVGHGKERQRSAIRASRITRFEAIFPDGGAADVRDGLHVGDPAADATLRSQLAQAGMLVLVTDTAAQSHLDARRFNRHLAEEGLAEVQAWRAARGRSGEGGSENYGRIAKALLRGGDGSAHTRPLALELEIVPLRSPYDPSVRELPVQVTFRGSPLKGASVKYYDLGRDEHPRSVCRTDSAGRCAFPLTRSGSWLLNVTWSTPNPAGLQTEFRTLFSSLAFGFDPAAPGDGEDEAG